MSVTSTSTSSVSVTSPPVRCDECGAKNPWIRHTVRLRSAMRVLCTHCVLRNHPTSFCPSCFAFYDSSPPHPSRRVSCSNCFSLTHSQCAADAKPPSYLCPPCRSPASFSFFDLSVRSDGVPFIDKQLADILLCAAKIAAASMTKAVYALRCDADRRAREAALARKRAREALEHVVMLAGKERARAVVPRLKEASVELSGSAANRSVHADVIPKPSPVAAAKNANGTVREGESSANAMNPGQIKSNGDTTKESPQNGNVKPEADASK
ncbi:PREDICTED: uncharacterized protein LOC104820490 [Tarenaya hassleriana]|uniref:uncharacterized protein LOC104820490 n=1 Tax=Tarenaya hassleriana TaxID=28532 RepID=UPI00053C6FDB|nr:PREDICTED: uncharacterized protein LOC104820490 [Tarenaya hassleriana]